MEIENEMRLGRDEQALLPPGHPFRFVFFNFVEEAGQVDDHSIAQDGSAALVDDTRGQQVEVVCRVANHNGVTCVITTLASTHDVG
jgi:hypothetical protein